MAFGKPLWKLPKLFSPKGKRKGHPLSASTKAKISAALKGRKIPHRAASSHKGHKLSAETKAKISAALKGKKRAARMAAKEARKLSAATKAKISAALKGRKVVGHAQSSATRAKISAALKLAPHTAHSMSAAARAKLSAALSARDRALAKAHKSTATAKRAAKPPVPGRNPNKRGKYRLITAGVHKRHPGLLHTHHRKRRRSLSLHRQKPAHRVWRKRRRR